MTGAMLGDHLVMVVTVATSLGAIALGVRRLGLRNACRGLPAALLGVLDWVWTAMAFFAGNVSLGIALVAAGRAFGAGPVSIYAADDISLVILSVAQAAAFRLWQSTARGGTRRSR